MIVQRDRNYLLKVISASGVMLEISGLNIQFKVSKSADNKKKGNHASVSIFNLSNANRQLLEDHNLKVQLDVGYSDMGLHELFAGDVTSIETKRQSEDLVTTLTLDSLYSGLNHKLVSKLIAPSTSLQDAIKQLSKEISGVTQTKFSGPTLAKKLIDGYPATGTPRQVLTEICDAYGLEWQIDSGILYVTDVNYSYMTNTQAFVLNEMSGLLERPMPEEIHKTRSSKDKKKAGVKGLSVSCLLNPIIKAGSTVKLEFAEMTGFYKVVEVSHSGEVYGNSWRTDLILGKKEG